MEAKEVTQLLNAKLENVPKAQIRSMGLEVMPRLIEALHNHKEKCSECGKWHDEGIGHVENIVDIFSQNLSAQRKFEKWVDQSQKHLKSEHEMLAKGKLTAVYVASGVVIGIILGALFTYFSQEGNMLGGIALGWVCGMMLGWILGKTKENKLRKRHQLY